MMTSNEVATRPDNFDFSQFNLALDQIIDHDKGAQRLFIIISSLLAGIPKAQFLLKNETDRADYQQALDGAGAVAAKNVNFADPEQVTDFKHDMLRFYRAASETMGGKTLLVLLLQNVSTHYEKQVSQLLGSLYPDYSIYQARHRDQIYSLEEAQELLSKSALADPTRPFAHPGGNAGSCSDPHGIYFDTENNDLVVFYQTNPYGTYWGAGIHWGTYSINQTGDLAFGGHPLVPDHQGGLDQVFHWWSGSYFAANGREHLFSSALTPLDNHYHQSPSCVLTKEPQSGEYLRTSIVTDHSTFPDVLAPGGDGKELFQLADIRDPFVTKIDGKTIMLFGGRLRSYDDDVVKRYGRVLVFACEPTNEQDLTEPWKYLGITYYDGNDVFAGGPGIIECPSIVEIADQQTGDKKHLLMFCQQRFRGKIRGRPGIESVEALIGEFDGETGEFTKEKQPLLDYSGDNIVYAATMTATPGEDYITFMAWLRPGNDDANWSGVHALRAVSLQNNRLHIAPHPLTEQLWISPALASAEQTAETNEQLNSEQGLHVSRNYHLKAKVNYAELSGAESELRFHATDCGVNYIALKFNTYYLQIGSDTNNHLPVMEEELTDEWIDFELVVDNLLVEIYLNGRVMTYWHRLDAERLEKDPLEKLFCHNLHFKEVEIKQLRNMRSATQTASGKSESIV